MHEDDARRAQVHVEPAVGEKVPVALRALSFSTHCAMRAVGFDANGYPAVGAFDAGPEWAERLERACEAFNEVMRGKA